MIGLVNAMILFFSHVPHELPRVRLLLVAISNAVVGIPQQCRNMLVLLRWCLLGYCLRNETRPSCRIDWHHTKSTSADCVRAEGLFGCRSCQHETTERPPVWVTRSSETSVTADGDRNPLRLRPGAPVPGPGLGHGRVSAQSFVMLCS